MLSSTGVKPSTSASGSQPSGNTKKDKIQQTPISTQKNKVEAHPRKVISSLKNKDCVVAPKGTANVQHSKLNANSELKRVKCNGCMLYDNHELCVFDFINNVNAHVKSKSVKKIGNTCPLTRITTTTEVPLRIPFALDNETPKPVVTLVYSRKPRKSKTNGPVSKSKVVEIVLWIWTPAAPTYTSDRSPAHQFRQYIEIVTISRVYYVERLGHNLFFVGKFCDLNLEVAFRQHTYFIRNLEGVDLLTGSRGNNLYTLSLGDMMASSPICLLSKASKTNKKKPYQPNSEDTNQEKLYSLHMDLCGPMRVASVNEKKYILVIVDDYSRFTWVKFLRSKDEAPDFIIKFLKMIQNLGKLQPKADIGIFIGYAPTKKAFQIYNRRTRRIIETIHVDFDELTAMASEHSSSGPTLHEMTPATISSGLVPNSPPSIPFVPPSRTDRDILFQPMFDELLTPPPSIDYSAPEVIALIAKVVAPVPAVSTGSPSSTTVDRDAPSPSNSQTTPETQPPLIPNDVEEDNHDIEVAQMGNDPYFSILILELPSDQSSSTNSIHTIVHPDHQISEHNSK
ncbi:retrovirus-related pol polyprotein from transposon TNT 1-94 [Tanacetum coccineum]